MATLSGGSIDGIKILGTASEVLGIKYSKVFLLLETAKDKGLAGEVSSLTKKKGRTMAITAEDMQKRKNDVKARTTLLLALPNEHQLRFSKYDSAKELREAILKTFGGNEATKKTKKNQLKQQYDDLNKKLLTSLAPEWLMYTIVWRNRDDLSTMSLDYVYNHLKVYEPKIDDDNIEEMDIKWNLALLSMRADRFWKKTGKKITIQGSDVDWSYMAGEDEASKNHALVADEEVPTEYALMAKSSSSSDNEVYDDSFWSKSCRKNTENLNTKISKINEELSDRETDLCNYKRGLSQVKARLVKFKENKIKYCKQIKVLERGIELKDNKIKYLRNELKEVKKEKESIDFKIENLKNASKDLDRLLGSQKLDKDMNGVGFNEYCDVPPPPVQVYSPPKKDLSWMGLPEFVYDTVTDYTRPTHSIDVSKSRIPQDNIDDKGYWDSGCSRHMTGNISYLSEYEPFNGGYVSFGHGRGKITGKSSIKTGKLEFKNVYFVEELKYNLFSMSQIYDNKNRVLFTDTKCLVLGKDFKLVDDKHVLLRTPRQHNMYTIDLKNIVPHKNLSCLIAKASVDESMLWHKRLSHLNFKTMNKLIRSNLVKGFPSKSFENDHSCVACLKRKQHKASCKSKIVNYVSKPFYTLHIDLFGPTSVSGLNHKWYCLVVTDIFLGKFDAKGNEGYFVGYNLSSKAFRVFNKRTKKIENLHVDFLENKSIEKGTGPDWLFNIDTLTNSMSYVPVVIAGTSSANSSGIKEDVHQAEQQEVNEDKEFPESSGNSNPTASTKVSINDSFELASTSTVETIVPTVSTHVPTDSLSAPSVTSSVPRIISRGGSSFPKPLSLGNAMSFENRLEDFFRYKSNAVRLNEMEADLSNMETPIQVSPTPTLKIHKEPPKSQIIGPVDTRVQTRQKTKNVDEQSFIAKIYQKTNPDLLQHCLFLCFLSQEEPKKIVDALKDPS
uniref:Putative ribonuclease H-like domain-containing protein n=1 Tax=Tanacetum cinerariifolium TaxID=118510 RepID=A0A699HFT5_TANCI|nr:putative ribonuclease H-like domain-containing protein [Tanacetum cinerariifolium]